VSDTETQIGHLLALRAVLTASLENVDACLADHGVVRQPQATSLTEPASGVPRTCPSCGASADRITDYTGNGAPKWMCSVCETKGGSW